MSTFHTLALLTILQWANIEPWKLQSSLTLTFQRPGWRRGYPTDYDITAQIYDSVLVGKETLGAGIEGGHVYTTAEMKPDTVAPVISLTGDNPSIVYIGENMTTQELPQ